MRTDDDLPAMSADLTAVEVRRMRDLPDDAAAPGLDFLWAERFNA